MWKNEVKSLLQQSHEDRVNMRLFHLQILILMSTDQAFTTCSDAGNVFCVFNCLGELEITAYFNKMSLYG